MVKYYLNVVASLTARFTWRPCRQPCSDCSQDRRHPCTYEWWPPPRTGRNKPTSDRGGGRFSLLILLFFSLSWWLLHHHHLPLSVLNMRRHLIDMRCFFSHVTSWRARACDLCGNLFCPVRAFLCVTVWIDLSSECVTIYFFIFMYAIWYFYYTSCIDSFCSVYLFLM